MQYKKHSIWLNFIMIVVALALVVSGCGKAKADITNSAASEVIIKVLDVGQGDSILIKTAQQVVLIDTGDTDVSTKLVKLLKNQDISKIDKVFITHPHSDHVGGMTALLDNFPVGQIYDSGQTATSKAYKTYLTKVKAKKIPFAIARLGQEIAIGSNTMLQVLSPGSSYIRGTSGDTNNNSIVLRLVHKGFAMLLMGDAEKAAEAKIIENYGQKIKSQILKSGHHGSNTASSAAFIKVATPEVVVISLGKNNEYHHPHPSVLKRYEKAKLKIFRTDLHGTVTIRVDGDNYSVTKEKDGK